MDECMLHMVNHKEIKLIQDTLNRVRKEFQIINFWVVFEIL